MPSDSGRRLPTVAPSEDGKNPGDRIRRILAASGEAHRSALTSALEEARGALRGLRSSGNGKAARVAGELGALALGPVDPERFAVLLEREEGLDPARLDDFEKAVSVLEEATAASTALMEVRVGDEGTLSEAVLQALRERGRAFGAVRALALLRTGEFRREEHAGLLDGLPFGQWRTLERELAPPLMVWVKGSHLDTVPALAEVLDGAMKIVLVVEGPCPPAPLARLIAPGVLVVQSDDVEALEAVSGFHGPAVAALVPESAAAFTHDPVGGAHGPRTKVGASPAPASDPGRADAPDAEADHRPPGLHIHRVPGSPPRSWIGGMSPAQQARDLEVLAAWSRGAKVAAGPSAPDGEESGPGAGPVGASEGNPAPTPDPTAEPAERLAAWLLSQAQLDDADGA